MLFCFGIGLVNCSKPTTQDNSQKVTDSQRQSLANSRNSSGKAFVLDTSGAGGMASNCSKNSLKGNENKPLPTRVGYCIISEMKNETNQTTLECQVLSNSSSNSAGSNFGGFGNSASGSLTKMDVEQFQECYNQEDKSLSCGMSTDHSEAFCNERNKPGSDPKVTEEGSKDVPVW